MKESNKYLLTILIILSILLLGMVSGYFIASLSMRRQVKDFMVSTRNWNKISYILSTAEKYYVDSVDNEKLTTVALQAALQSLDPHSVYLEPEPLKKSDQDLAGDFEGVGLVFNVPNDTAVVIEVVPGGPSDKVGIQAGDRILKVDDVDIAGVRMAQDSMVRMMRGPKDTKVRLTIGRLEENIPFDIVRDKIPEKSVQAYFLLKDATGYLSLSKFSSSTYKECLNAINALLDKGMKRLVLDLRGNSGGYLDQCCNLANEFLPKDALIVYTEGRNSPRSDVKADGKGHFPDLPIAVLIDDGSASASEIIAGAIQDNDRGVVVGRRSFGKGLVQEPFNFTDGSGIRLTVARFHTPSGRCIQKPYTSDYGYDFYSRYMSGELMSKDKIQIDSSKVFTTVSGRTVYGGGGIIPDVYVPLDTTRTTNFYQQCHKKALMLRFASKFVDRNRSQLSSMNSFDKVKSYVDNCGVDVQFRDFAASQGVRCSDEEWNRSEPYMLPYICGLCARYSKVGEEAYYRYVLPSDDVVKACLMKGFSE